LPARVRLVAAPGELRDVELEVLGWRTWAGELMLRCRLVDGSVGDIPAAWTDLPRRVVVSRPLHDPAPVREWLPEVARMLDAPDPRHVPPWGRPGWPPARPARAA